MSRTSESMFSTSPEEVVGTPTLDPPGRITDAELIAGEQLRVIIRHNDGPIQTAYDRVEADPDRANLIDTVRGLCNGPDASGTPSTMAGWPSIQGRMADRYGLSPEESDAAVRRALEARDLSTVRWDGNEIQRCEGAEGTRCVFPLEETHVRGVIAEFATEHERRGDLIEHCQALLEEVDG